MGALGAGFFTPWGDTRVHVPVERKGKAMASTRKRIWRSGGKTKTSWLADYSDQDGKRHVKTFETKKAADAWLVGARGEVQRGTHTADAGSITIEKAGSLWYERGRVEKRERSTLAERELHMRLHINPAIGGIKLSRLSTPAIESFRDDLLRKNSQAMARKILVSLKGILNDAQRRGLVAQNVARPVKIEINRRETGKLRVGRDIPSKQEIQAMVAAVQGRWRPLFLTAIFTGMRASELRGLTWADVHFDSNMVEVRQRANLWGEIGAPKSAAGHREIPMSPMVGNALREWRLACPKGPLNLVFPNGKGRVENHGNITNRGFYALQRAAAVVDGEGRVKYGLHALRHFCASWLIEQGFSPKRLQVLLGHSSIQMTFDRYGHLFPSLEDDHAKFAAGELALVGQVK